MRIRYCSPRTEYILQHDQIHRFLRLHGYSAQNFIDFSRIRQTFRRKRRTPRTIMLYRWLKRYCNILFLDLLFVRVYIRQSTGLLFLCWNQNVLMDLSTSLPVLVVLEDICVDILQLRDRKLYGQVPVETGLYAHSSVRENPTCQGL